MTIQVKKFHIKASERHLESMNTQPETNAYLRMSGEQRRSSATELL